MYWEILFTLNGSIYVFLKIEFQKLGLRLIYCINASHSFLFLLDLLS